MLPTFVIIGAAKAGTTALYWYLADHPEVFMSPVKETNYFAFGLDDDGRPLYGDPDLHRFPIRSFAEYEALFAGSDGALAVGEASPIYLECPQSAARIRDVVPGARIVCFLREPVDRAYSDYLMYLRARGRRLDPDRDLTPDAPWARPGSHWMQISRYHEALSRFYERFPREQIDVFLFDDLKTDAAACVRAVFAALGVDPAFTPDLQTPHNIGGLPASRTLERILTSRSVRRVVEPWIPRRVSDAVRRVRTKNLKKAPPLPDQLRAELLRHFRDDIGQTATLIGRNLDHWLPPA
ncbi:MAG TPA: sulfotransferase [Actinomycetota bacterium]